MMGKGSWYIHSKSNKRFRASGRCYCGGFVTPQEVKDKLKQLEAKYGKAPKDTEWGYMKD